MTCNMCGRESVNIDANFCYYCGASLKDGGPEAIYIKQQETADSMHKKGSPQGLFSDFFTEATTDGKEHPVTFKQWLFLLFVMLVPMVGVFIYFILLFVLALNSRVKQTLRNWARAMLILLAVSFAMLTSVMPELMSFMGGV